jgi:hypothetical protein
LQRNDCTEIVDLISSKIPAVREQQTDGTGTWLDIGDEYRALRDLMDESERGWRGRIKEEHLEREFIEVGGFFCLSLGI